MQKIILLTVCGLLGLLVFFFVTSNAEVQYSAGTQDQVVLEDEYHDVNDHSHTAEESHDAVEVQEQLEMSESEAMYRSGGTYLDSYELTSVEFGTDVSVSVDGTNRIMEANSLANHDVGEFPRTGNPNTISAQNNTYTFPLNPTYIGTPQFAREPGVAINGVKFEPQTAERVVCATGEVYSIEAVQDVLNLGLDFNNAHVQPTGAYHYHAVADNLVEVFDVGNDLVHVGFAKDGYLMYYSKSGMYQSGYSLTATPRIGTDCTYTSPSVQIDEDLTGTTPDGTYVSDWEHTAADGVLDECNGAVIDGEYTYVITDEYPYIPRCLMGEFTESTPQGGGGQQGQNVGPSGLSPQGQGGLRPNGPPTARQ
jgi:hypothetical protein